MNPQAEQESFFDIFGGWGRLEVGVVHLVALDRLLRATTKKVVYILRKKVTPDKILAGYAYVWYGVVCC